ncbi:hypothetical protein CEXT_301531 [Caerostris extrusa]|uniref:Uncharacterized protein n=1 Tax=Caerostris extrusa TaxID=172846 RepID=A0AAV4Q220_CAEEX|nr:hypothetical protein CEXT_301531 [Caerostris extrusa]
MSPRKFSSALFYKFHFSATSHLPGVKASEVLKNGARETEMETIHKRMLTICAGYVTVFDVKCIVFKVLAVDERERVERNRKGRKKNRTKSFEKVHSLEKKPSEKNRGRSANSLHTSLIFRKVVLHFASVHSLILLRWVCSACKRKDGGVAWHSKNKTLKVIGSLFLQKRPVEMEL